MNKVILFGRLTKDIELRKTQTGLSVATYTVAVDRKFSKEKQTDFINCVAWNKTADYLEFYSEKGMQILVEGQIQTRNYEGNDGKKVYVTEVLANNVSLIFNQKKENTEPKEEEKFTVDDLQTLDISDEDLPF